MLITYFYLPPLPAKNSYESTSQEIANKEYTVNSPYAESSPYQLETTEGVKRYIQYLSDTYRLNDSFYQTIQCESNFNHEGLFGDGTKAYGILQFHEPTFDQFCTGDYHGLVDQLNCGAKMFSEGYAFHWTCYNRIIALNKQL